MNYPIRGKFLRKKPLPVRNPLVELDNAKKQILNTNKEFTSLEAKLVEAVEVKVNEVDTKLEEVNTTLNSVTETVDALVVETTKEFEQLKNEVIDHVNNLEPQIGVPGQDADEQRVIDAVLKVLEPKTKVTIDTKKLVKAVLKALPESKASLKIITKNIELDPMSVIDKIMGMKKFKLKTSNIDGLDQTISAFNNQIARRGYLHGGGDTVTAGTNVTVTTNSAGQKVISAVSTPISLQTNSVLNGSQAILNLIAGTNVTLTDNGFGGITITAATAGGTVTSVQSADGSVTVTNISTTPDLSVVKAPKLSTARTIGGVSFDGTANITVATATGGFTISGGDLTLGVNNLTMTGSLGTTGARLTKGWFTDLQVTNTISGSITGNAATVTTNANLTGVITSVGNATSIASQTGTGTKFVVDTSPTIVTPVITQIVPGANFTLKQNSVNALTSEETGATVNTLYLKTGLVGIGAVPIFVLDVESSVASTNTGILMKNTSASADAGASLFLDATAQSANAKWRIGTGLPSSGALATNLTFYNVVQGATAMTIQQLGNVGIGTTTPTSSNGNVGKILEVATGNSNVAVVFSSAATSGSNAGGVFEARSTASLSGGDARLGQMSWTRTTDVTSGKLSTVFDLYVNNDGTLTEGIRIAPAGAIRFPAYGAGTATFDASGNITSVSDETFKDIQGSFTVGLNEILNLQPILYKWKSETGFDTMNTYAGFSAQNVLKSIPEAIGQKNGAYSLLERPIIAALINAVKELSAQVDELRAKQGLPTIDRGIQVADPSRRIVSPTSSIDSINNT